MFGFNFDLKSRITKNNFHFRSTFSLERTWEKNLVIKVHQVLSRLEWMWIVVDSSLATEAGKEY